jgi:hypothetical protein
MSEQEKNYNAELAKLFEKAITENRKWEQDNSYHFAKTGKRDVVVHMAVTVLPRVDGHTIFGEKERELVQFCFEIPARAFPARVSMLKKAFSELMTRGYQTLMKIGAVREG